MWSPRRLALIPATALIVGGVLLNATPAAASGDQFTLFNRSPFTMEVIYDPFRDGRDIPPAGFDTAHFAPVFWHREYRVEIRGDVSSVTVAHTTQAMECSVDGDPFLRCTVTDVPGSWTIEVTYEAPPVFLGYELPDAWVEGSYSDPLPIDLGVNPRFVTVDGLPDQMWYDEVTHQIMGTPVWTGDYLLDVTAANDYGVTRAGVRLFVTAPAPQVLGPALTWGSVGDPLITGVYLDLGGVLRYDAELTATGLPSFLVFDPLTATIYGTPTYAATFNVVVTATTAGGTTTKVLQIVILP